MLPSFDDTKNRIPKDRLFCLGLGGWVGVGHGGCEDGLNFGHLPSLRAVEEGVGEFRGRFAKSFCCGL